jgi:3',5'-cyclic AMP phosphodiesterase CpdA
MRKLITVWLAAFAAGTLLSAQQAVELPLLDGSVRFAVIGDNGTGDPPEYDVGRQMAAARARFPFEFVIMLGDNMYGRQQPQDFVDKFERPYAALLQAGVPFYATLGNHDNPNNRSYKGFNMGGERYYTFVRKHVRFVVLDSNLMDAKQLAWLEGTLKAAEEPWKVCYFHHPLYSEAGRHGPNVELRVAIEPMLVRYGVNVVFSGHEHVYERIRPQKGITYFIDGSSGQLRRGDMSPTAMTAASFDQDQTFMLVEIAGESLFFKAISRSGLTVDSGAIPRRPTT